MNVMGKMHLFGASFRQFIHNLKGGKENEKTIIKLIARAGDAGWYDSRHHLDRICGAQMPRL